MTDQRDGLSYASVGVDTAEADSGLRSLAGWITRTFDFHAARPLLPLGYYANVIPLTRDMAVAIATDGVGTKLLVAEKAGRFDTVGIDCVAMNANDIVCVGARPLALVDYVAVDDADPAFLAELGKGLCEGAGQAGISIPGGELAQVRELLHDPRDGRAFDLVGTCIGTVHPDRLIVGEEVQPGDVVVGLASNGIHSNGLTLARRVLLDKAGLALDGRVDELGRTLAEELLAPTRMYVRAAVAMMDEEVPVRAFAHITGDGLLNLARTSAAVGFEIDHPLDVPPIFSLIQRHGRIDDAEMFGVYNMGIGFCIVVPESEADRTATIAREHGHVAAVIGRVVADPERRVRIPQRGLVGTGKTFRHDR